MTSPSQVPASGFGGFGRDSPALFRELERDNTRAYYEAHREEWEREVRGPMRALLEEVARGLDAPFRLFRQERGVRFSRRDGAYKLKTYGVVAPSTGSGVARYVEISSAGLFVASGYYEMAPDQLARYRAGAADDARGAELERLVAIAAAASLSVTGKQGGAPRGTRKDHPRLELLRQRSLLCGARLSADEPTLYQHAAQGFVTATWAGGAAIGTWLDQNVGPSGTETVTG